MFPIRAILFLATALAVGALLALGAVTFWIPMGWIGAIGLLAWGFVARRRWARLQTVTGLEPGAPERILWANLAGDGLILGHLATALSLRDIDFHFGQGNSLALDSWTMIGASFLTLALFRTDSREKDERHAEVAAGGVRAGYATLVGTMIAFLLWLAFLPDGAASFFFLAHVIIALLLVSHVAMLLAQLAAYARDTRAAMADAVDEPAP